MRRCILYIAYKQATKKNWFFLFSFVVNILLRFFFSEPARCWALAQWIYIHGEMAEQHFQFYILYYCVLMLVRVWGVRKQNWQQRWGFSFILRSSRLFWLCPNSQRKKEWNIPATVKIRYFIATFTYIHLARFFRQRRWRRRRFVVFFFLSYFVLCSLLIVLSHFPRFRITKINISACLFTQDRKAKKMLCFTLNNASLCRTQNVCVRCYRILMGKAFILSYRKNTMLMHTWCTIFLFFFSLIISLSTCGATDALDEFVTR